MRFGEENNIKNAIWRKKKYHFSISNTGKDVIKLFDEYKKMMLEKKAKKKVSFCKKKYKNGKRGKIGEIISIKNIYSALCFCQTPY